MALRHNNGEIMRAPNLAFSKVNSMVSFGATRQPTAQTPLVSSPAHNQG